MESDKPNFDCILEDFLDIECATGPESIESEIIRSLIIGTLRLEDVSSELSKVSLSSDNARNIILKDLYNIKLILDATIAKIEHLNK